MNWPVAGLCLVFGGGVGFMLAPKGKSSDDPEGKGREQKEIKTVRSTRFSGSSGVVLDRILSGTGVSADVIGKMKTPKDWVKMLQENALNAKGMMDIQKQMLDMGIFMKLIPNDQLEGVVTELGKAPENGDMMQKMMGKFFVYTLTDRWYETDPEGLKAWALDGNSSDSGERVQMLIVSALEHNPEEGLALYEQHKDTMQSGMMQMFGEVEGKVAQSKLEVEGVSGYWDFYDSLTSQQQNNLGYSMKLDLEPAQFSEFYQESEKRLADSEEYKKSQGRTKIFSDWGDKDTESLVEWYGSNKNDLEKSAKASALQAMVGNSEGVADDVIRAELAESSDLVAVFMKDRGSFGLDGDDSIENKIALLPEGTAVTGAMLRNSMSNMQWYNPQESVALARHITDPEDRYNTLEKNLTNFGNFGNSGTTADLAIIERGLAEVDLTPEQRAELLATAAKDPKAK